MFKFARDYLTEPTEIKDGLRLLVALAKEVGYLEGICLYRTDFCPTDQLYEGRILLAELTALLEEQIAHVQTR